MKSSSMVFLLGALVCILVAPDAAAERSPQLRLVKKFGTACVTVGIKENLPYDDDRVTEVVEVRNGCKSAQIVSVMLGTGLMAQGIWHGGNGSRLLWPSNRTPPPLPFVPLTQLQSGFLLQAGESATSDVIQFLQNVETIKLSMGSCDAAVNGIARASFHDAELSRGFVCATIENKPKVETARLTASNSILAYFSPDDFMVQDITPAVINFNRCRKPEWPKASLRNEEQGAVTLAFLVSPSGAITDAKVRKSSGFRDLDYAALDAIKECVAQPARRAGKAVEYWLVMQYVWTLE